VVVPDLPRRAIRSSCCGNNSGKWALPRARRQDQRLVFHRRHPAAAATRSRRSVHRLDVERMRFSMCVLHPSYPFRGWVSAGHNDPVISSSCVFVCARACALRLNRMIAPIILLALGPRASTRTSSAPVCRRRSRSHSSRRRWSSFTGRRPACNPTRARRRPFSSLTLTAHSLSPMGCSKSNPAPARSTSCLATRSAGARSSSPCPRCFRRGAATC
jgi:hypothetical protein